MDWTVICSARRWVGLQMNIHMLYYISFDSKNWGWWICWHRKNIHISKRLQQRTLSTFCPPLTSFVDILRVIWLTNIIKNKGDNEIIWYKDKLTTIWLILTNNLKSSFPIQYFIQHHFSIPFFTDLTIFCDIIVKGILWVRKDPKKWRKNKGGGIRNFWSLVLDDH